MKTLLQQACFALFCGMGAFLLTHANESDRAKEATGKKTNHLTAEQKKEGWKLLFDGKSLVGWRGYKEKKAPISWEVRDGAIFCNDKPGPDLLTVDQFGDFDLSIDWKISNGGNSGIHLRATEVTADTASKLRVEQNGVEICATDMSGDDWKKRLARSKFATMQHFNKATEGHIALQNYRGAGVWYRNIMIRPISR